MPKRVIDGEGIWTSFKLKQLPEHFRLHYSHLLPLASANGTFEYDPHLIHARCYAFLLPHISVDDVVHICEAFARVGLLYRWTCKAVEHCGHNFGFWVGMEKPGRLPKPSRLRDRHERISCLHMQKDGLLQYVENTTCYQMGRQWVPEGSPMVSLGFGFGFGFGSGSGSNTQDHMFYKSSSNGKTTDDLKQLVLAKCEDDSKGTLSKTLDVIIERAESSGVKIQSTAYLEKALNTFNFETGPDRESLQQRMR